MLTLTDGAIITVASMPLHSVLEQRRAAMTAGDAQVSLVQHDAYVNSLEVCSSATTGLLEMRIFLSSAAASNWHMRECRFSF
jgi:hypothetical protein